MVKVLVVSAAFPPMSSGESTNAFYLCQHLAERNLDVHVLTTHSSATACARGITVHPIMQRWSWPEVPRFIKFLKQ
jgi:hypothetical protein